MVNKVGPLGPVLPARLARGKAWSSAASGGRWVAGGLALSAAATSLRPAAAAPAPASPKALGLGDRLQATWNSITSGAQAAGGYLQGMLGHESGQWANPKAPAPPSGAQGLRMATYNAYVRVSRPEGMLAELKALDADVVALQEADPTKAKALAEALGMHLAWQDRKGCAYGGVALLSRFPIEAVAVAKTPVPFHTRAGSFVKELVQGKARASALDPRFVLEAQLKVGGKPVTVLATHLTLIGADAQAQEWAYLASRAEALKAQGQAVVLAGDFNAELGHISGQAAKGGNAAQPVVATAMARLGRSLQDAWVGAEAREVKVGGQTLGAEAAAAKAKGLPAKEAEALTRAAAGATLGGEGRIDGLLVSGFKTERAYVDRDAKASDHRPLVADLRWP